MALSIGDVVFDCADPEPVMEFWAAALGYDRREADTIGPRDPGGTGPILQFQGVPEPKTVKNRVHLDLRADDLEAEVARLEGLGARVLQAFNEASGRRRVMADPEGNEFCLASRA